MATNIEMNIMQNNGQYETIYPQTIVENIIDLQTTLSNYYTKTETLQGSTAQLYGLDTNAIPDTVFSTIKTLINTAQNTADSAPKITLGSYIGTGTSGPSYPNSVTSNFPMKFFWIYGYRDGTSDGSVFYGFDQTLSFFSTILPVEEVGTSYSGYFVLCINTPTSQHAAKRSSDYKTIYWYGESGNAREQFNTKGSKYFYIIIG